MKALKLCENLYRIKVPFEDIYTTVYVAVYEGGAIIIDSATFASDVDNYILPALSELGLNADNVKYLLLTHSHGDHSGGIARLFELFPEAEIKVACKISLPQHSSLADNEILLGNLKAIYLPGHTADTVGFYDISTKTLLSGDCLPLNGVSKYRGKPARLDLYKESIAKLKRMNIERIVAAHEYDPLGSIAEGADAVNRYLDMCLLFIQ